MDLTAQEIQEKQFHDAWRGYRQEEVDDFLDQVSEALDRALRENAALKERNHELGQAVATARDTEEMLKKTLVTAQRAAEEAIASAQAKAAAIVAEAEERAGRLEAGTEERRRRADAEIQERKRTTDAEIRSALDDADKAAGQKRRELEGTIDRLEAYEGELKLRLKTFLEQQQKALSVLADRRVAHRGVVRAPTQAVVRGGSTGARVPPYSAASSSSEEEVPEGDAHPEEGHYRRTLRNLFTREEGTAALRPMIGPQGSGAGEGQVIRLEEEEEGVRVLPKDSGAGKTPQEEDRPERRE